MYFIQFLIVCCLYNQSRARVQIDVRIIPTFALNGALIISNDEIIVQIEIFVFSIEGLQFTELAPFCVVIVVVIAGGRHM